MAPPAKASAALLRKIANLQLEIKPFVPMPEGPVHASFPKTLTAFHLLTEEELDSLAHYYHQSTPGPWTFCYPAIMNWDKDFLAKNSPVEQRSFAQQQEQIYNELMQTVNELRNTQNSATEPLRSDAAETTAENNAAGHFSNRTQFKHLSKKERVHIKRRMFGKFIGLRGMETPVEEIAGRLQASLDRAVEKSRREMRENEEFFTRRKKGF